MLKPTKEKLTKMLVFYLITSAARMVWAFIFLEITLIPGDSVVNYLIIPNIIISLILNPGSFISSNLLFPHFPTGLLIQLIYCYALALVWIRRKNKINLQSSNLLQTKNNVQGRES